MTASGDPKVAESWDAEYRAGRYAGEGPMPFVRDILTAALENRIEHGLYVGCGNGRNFVPLSRAGLTLTGVDDSAVALQQLTQRCPSYRERLLLGDLSSLPARSRFPLVIGIQAFQHGNRATCHANIRTARGHLERGGLFCLRVNATGTEYPHEVEEVESSRAARGRSATLQGQRRASSFTISGNGSSKGCSPRASGRSFRSDE